MQNANIVPDIKTLAVAFSLLEIGQVESLVGLKKSAIYARVRTGDFPAPVVLGERCVRWRSDELQNWMQAKSDARTASVDTTRHIKARKAASARHTQV